MISCFSFSYSLLFVCLDARNDIKNGDFEVEFGLLSRYGPRN